MTQTTTSNIPPDDLQDSLNFLAYMEGSGRKHMNPLSQEGLDIQAQYVRDLPQHPMDVLQRLMVNPFCSPNERINAAKTLMQYSMRAVPSNIDVTSGGQAIKLDASALAKLNPDELATMEGILSKISGT